MNPDGSKARILHAIHQQQVVHNAISLVLPVGIDAHNLTHQLWRLQKTGHVNFRTTRTSNKAGETPIKIKLTKKGRDFVERHPAHLRTRTS